MENKEQIKKLRDNAELAMASYGYFNLVGKKFNDNDLKKQNSTQSNNYLC